MSELVGAARGERAPEERVTHRNGYRPRPWATRAGELEPAIPLDVDEVETEAFWLSFLRGLVERGLGGVQLVVSDAHTGLKKAIGQVLGCPWQR